MKKVINENLKEEKKIMNSLGLHEGYTTNFGIYIMRIYGGFLYDCWDFENDIFKTGIYIPDIPRF